MKAAIVAVGLLVFALVPLPPPVLFRLGTALMVIGPLLVWGTTRGTKDPDGDAFVGDRTWLGVRLSNRLASREGLEELADQWGTRIGWLLFLAGAMLAIRAGWTDGAWR